MIDLQLCILLVIVTVKSFVLIVLINFTESRIISVLKTVLWNVKILPVLLHQRWVRLYSVPWDDVIWLSINSTFRVKWLMTCRLNVRVKPSICQRVRDIFVFSPAGKHSTQSSRRDAVTYYRPSRKTKNNEHGILWFAKTQSAVRNQAIRRVSKVARL